MFLVEVFWWTQTVLPDRIRIANPGGTHNRAE